VNSISDSDLLALFRRGFVPGPKEEEEAFLTRIAHLEAFYAEPPIDEKELVPLDDWKEAQKWTQELFGITPDWMVAFYRNRHLPLWQGAAAWIFEHPMKVPLLQLKEAFRKGSYLNLYTRKEVLAHEAAHSIRMAFEEKQFEEILAYSTSQSVFRRWMGPLFRTSTESYLFMVLLALPLIVEALKLFWQEHPLLSIFSYLPGIALVFAFLRLLKSRYTFSKALKKIEMFLDKKEEALSFALCLTDEEIHRFAKSPLKDLELYIQEQKELALRWRLLFLAFLK
jgi:hypothetical protein